MPVRGRHHPVKFGEEQRRETVLVHTAAVLERIFAAVDVTDGATRCGLHKQVIHRAADDFPVLATPRLMPARHERQAREADDGGIWPGVIVVGTIVALRPCEVRQAAIDRDLGFGRHEVGWCGHRAVLRVANERDHRADTAEQCRTRKPTASDGVRVHFFAFLSFSEIAE